jgi:hypothetical protein
MKRARNGNPGLIKSTGYEGAKGDELGWKPTDRLFPQLARSSARLGDIPNAAPPSGLVATETAKPGLILRSDSQRNVSREWMPPPSPRAGSGDMKN